MLSNLLLLGIPHSLSKMLATLELKSVCTHPTSKINTLDKAIILIIFLKRHIYHVQHLIYSYLNIKYTADRFITE